MKTLTQHLTQYAAYHRDKRNIATHFVGIPMIMFAVGILTARPMFELAGLTLAPVALVSLGAAAFYLRLDLRFGLVMSALLVLVTFVGLRLAAEPTEVWLGVGLGLFVMGWIIQFVGHVYEQRKPAFVDDLIGLLVGPLFVTAELAFLLGLRREVLRDIEAEVGPTLIRAPRAAGA
jgi:uncharacterized membrane protein YGL010W